MNDASNTDLRIRVGADVEGHFEATVELGHTGLCAVACISKNTSAGLAVREVAEAIRTLYARRDRIPSCGQRVHVPGLGRCVVSRIKRDEAPNRVWVRADADGEDIEVDWSACKYPDES